MAITKFCRTRSKDIGHARRKYEPCNSAHKLGFDLTIIEKDPVYYEQAKKRLIEFQRQQVLF